MWQVKPRCGPALKARGGFTTCRCQVSARFVWLSVGCLFVAAGCRDEGADRYARARQAYDALLDQHTPADAPAFDAVLAELEEVPKDSPRAAEAQRLAQAIRLARQPRVRTPLALGAKAGRHPALEAQLQACARVAELAGADGGVDRRALEALEACRRRAERLELELSHPGESPAAHPAEGPGP